MDYGLLTYGRRINNCSPELTALTGGPCPLWNRGFHHKAAVTPSLDARFPEHETGAGIRNQVSR
jgi:hypothetical protein